jgi:hypothetical protein
MWCHHHQSSTCPCCLAQANKIIIHFKEGVLETDIKAIIEEVEDSDGKITKIIETSRLQRYVAKVSDSLLRGVAKAQSCHVD